MCHVELTLFLHAFIQYAVLVKLNSALSLLINTVNAFMKLSTLAIKQAVFTF